MKRIMISQASCRLFSDNYEDIWVIILPKNVAVRQWTVLVYILAVLIWEIRNVSMYLNS